MVKNASVHNDGGLWIVGLSSAVILFVLALVLVCVFYGGSRGMPKKAPAGLSLSFLPDAAKSSTQTGANLQSHGWMTSVSKTTTPSQEEAELLELHRLVRPELMLHGIDQNQGTDATPVVSRLDSQQLAKTEWTRHWTERWNFPIHEWRDALLQFSQLYQMAAATPTEGPVVLRRWRDCVVDGIMRAISDHLHEWHRQENKRMQLRSINLMHPLERVPWMDTLMKRANATDLVDKIGLYLEDPPRVSFSTVADQMRRFFAETFPNAGVSDTVAWAEALRKLEQEVQGVGNKPPFVMKRYLALCTWHEAVKGWLLPDRILPHGVDVTRICFMPVQTLLRTVVLNSVERCLQPDQSIRPDALEKDIREILCEPIARFSIEDE